MVKILERPTDQKVAGSTPAGRTTFNSFTTISYDDETEIAVEVKTRRDNTVITKITVLPVVPPGPIASRNFPLWTMA